MQIRSVFVSRPLDKDSPFLSEEARSLGIVAMGQSLLKMQPIELQQAPTELDFLFFYSKTGVEFFFSQLASLGLAAESLPPCGALGEGTARILRKYTQDIDFIGDGNAQTAAEYLLSKRKSQRIGFVRARNSVQSVQALLSADINCKDLIVYDNIVDCSFVAPQAQMLVFTSPMNVEAYFEAQKRQKSTQMADFVVVIGHTTEKRLLDFYDGNYAVSAQTAENALWEELKKFVEKSI